MSNKILCLGTNSELTDSMSTEVSAQYLSKNCGLIDRNNLDVSVVDGVYHTSLADLSVGEILSLAKRFDLIVMLDQHRKEWSHWKLLQTTYKTMIDLESQGHATQFRNNKNVISFERMKSLVADNKSWCIYPWINLVTRDDRESNGIPLCARSPTMISSECSIDAWNNSTQRKEIQQSMLEGKLLPEHCNFCYDYERRGIESYREYESLDWCNQLGIESFSDLSKISSPKYYEIHWSNKCNLKCRSCGPSRSSAIVEEFKKHNVVMPFLDIVPVSHPPIDIVDIDSLDITSRVYISGGEPVIMPETLEFMKKCIQSDHTDFELTMSTNGVKFPQAFINASQHFANLNLSFSLDGYKEINDYWRSGSRWSSIVANMHLAQSMGHSVTVNTVPGIYNVTNLHLLLEWLDQEFPLTVVYMQINHVEIQSAYNHPDRDAVIASMERCQKTKIYWSDGKSCRSAIDSILDYYKNNHKFSVDDLRGFFEYNDRLDEIRGVKLGDFIPELEACRKLLG